MIRWSCRRAALLAWLVVLLGPSPAAAWGFDVHRYITGQAIALLPAEIRPFYEKNRVFLVEHSIDPDLWRSAGFAEEPPRHFLDFDAYGAYPFRSLPRDYTAAVRKFGRARVEKYGTLPWRIAEFASHLEKAMAAERQGTSPYAIDNIRFFSAVVAHYTADAHVPLHAVFNYDGQLTNQHGIHSRFETELFLRYGGSLSLHPEPRKLAQAPRDFAFDALLSSFQAAERVLAADREAIGGGVEYDEQYFDRFFALARPVLEARLTAAIEGVAAMITGAWEAGGKPSLPLEPPAVVRKRGASSNKP